MAVVTNGKVQIDIKIKGDSASAKRAVDDSNKSLKRMERVSKDTSDTQEKGFLKSAKAAFKNAEAVDSTKNKFEMLRGIVDWLPATFGLIAGAVLGAAEAFGSLGSSIANADKLADLKQKFDSSLDSIVGFTNAIRQAGVDIDKALAKAHSSQLEVLKLQEAQAKKEGNTDEVARLQMLQQKLISDERIRLLEGETDAINKQRSTLEGIVSFRESELANLKNQVSEQEFQYQLSKSRSEEDRKANEAQLNYFKERLVWAKADYYTAINKLDTFNKETDKLKTNLELQKKLTAEQAKLLTVADFMPESKTKPTKLPKTKEKTQEEKLEELRKYFSKAREISNKAAVDIHNADVQALVDSQNRLQELGDRDAQQAENERLAERARQYQAMAMSLDTVSNALYGVANGTSVLDQTFGFLGGTLDGLVEHMDSLIGGKQGALLAIGQLGAAYIRNEKARAGFLAAIATADALRSLAQVPPNIPGFIAGTGAAAIYAAKAGTSGGKKTTRGNQPARSNQVAIANPVQSGGITINLNAPWFGGSPQQAANYLGNVMNSGQGTGMN